jgi:DNA-binding transcriptional ArsR family regulator
MRVRPPWSDPLAESAALLKVIAHPLRFRILHLLAQADVCHCHLFRALSVPEGVAERHVRLLCKWKLAHAIRGSYFVYFRLAEANTRPQQLVMEIVRSLMAETENVAADVSRLRAIQGSALEGHACRSELHEPER